MTKLNINWEALEWRHHDVGMLQAYLDDETRIHIWSKLLQRVEAFEGPIHTHRCELWARVVTGEIGHRRIMVEEGHGLFKLWSDEMVEVGDARLSYEAPEGTKQAGDDYHVPCGGFHHAYPLYDSPAVTIVRMGRKVGWSRILTTGLAPRARVNKTLPPSAPRLIVSARAAIGDHAWGPTQERNTITASPLFT